MKKLDHENVIKLVEVINDETADKLFMGNHISLLINTSNGICRKRIAN